MKDRKPSTGKKGRIPFRSVGKGGANPIERGETKKKFPGGEGREARSSYKGKRGLRKGGVQKRRRSRPKEERG